MKRIVICGVQTLFVRGGAETHIDNLRHQLTYKGFKVDVVNLPYKDMPRSEILKGFLAWRFLDLLEMHGQDVDMIISTKFPSYAVNHPNKIVWLLHQHRQAYELYGTRYSDMHTRPDGWLFSALVRWMDNSSLSNARKVFTTSKNVSRRLLKYNNIPSEHLYHPPPLHGRFRTDGYGDYLLAVGRLEPIKRVDLVLEAMARATSNICCVIVGDGLQMGALKALAAARGLEGRVKFAGWVSDEELVELYAGCFGVIYPPFEEDYGYVTVESFLSRKPVITTSDSGGVLEFVEDEVTGYVAPPEPEALGRCIDQLYSRKDLCRSMGEAGYEVVSGINWGTVLDRLTETL